VKGSFLAATWLAVMCSMAVGTARGAETPIDGNGVGQEPAAAACPTIAATKPSANAGDSAGLVERAFCNMYDLNFAQAQSELAEFTRERPEDPLGPAAQAAGMLFSIFEQHKILQAEFFVSDDRFTKQKKIVVGEGARGDLESALALAEQLGRQALQRNVSDANALFALTLVYGLRADNAALVERQDLKALGFSNKSNEWAHKLLAISPESYDANVGTGIQKYLVSLKPAPVRFFLRLKGIKGNRDEGLQELQLAADKGHYLAPFARVLLAIAHLRKQELPESLALLRGLREQFPHNSLFEEEIARLAQAENPASPSSRNSTKSQGSMRGQ
jgi:hypothetical protein